MQRAASHVLHATVVRASNVAARLRAYVPCACQVTPSIAQRKRAHLVARAALAATRRPSAKTVHRESFSARRAGRSASHVCRVIPSISRHRSARRARRAALAWRCGVEIVRQDFSSASLASLSVRRARRDTCATTKRKTRAAPVSWWRRARAPPGSSAPAPESQRRAQTRARSATPPGRASASLVRI